MTNPILHYDLNNREEAVQILLNKYKSLEVQDNGNIILRTNLDDNDPTFTKNGLGYYVSRENAMKWPSGEYLTPFEILCRVKFKGDYKQAISHVERKDKKFVEPYFRCVADWFKQIETIDQDGIKRTEVKAYKVSEIARDIGKDAMAKLPRYESFTLEPNNINYQQIVHGNMYNTYQPPAWKAKKCKSLDEIPWSKMMVDHIFQGQIAKYGKNKGREMGWMYLQSLWCNPKRMLPTPGLASDERQTGKTTFINWILKIVGANGIIISPSNIGSQFNSVYAAKTFIAIEESKFDKSSDLEKLKQIATQKHITVNPKQTQEYTAPFYGHLMITSNNVKKMLIVDQKEIRYWMLRIPVITVENHSIEEDLQKEIPKLLGYLEQLPELDYSGSRMLFTAEELGTELLESVKDESMGGLHHDIMEYMDEWFINKKWLDKVSFTPKMLKDEAFRNDGRIGLKYIATVIDEMVETNEYLGDRKIGRVGYWYLGNPEFNGSNEIHTKRQGKMWTWDNPYYDADARYNQIQEDKEDIPF